MKKLIVITVLLVVAVAYVTFEYFDNLNPPGMRTSRVINEIPNTAAVIFQFSNDNSFYDIFKDDSLFPAVAGVEETASLDSLRRRLLLNPILAPYFSGRNVFLSLHPVEDTGIQYLVTLSAAKGINLKILSDAARQPHSGFTVKLYKSSGVAAYAIYLSALKRTFYLIDDKSDIFSGSFSKQLIDACAASKKKKSEAPPFVLLSQQQSANSLANIYINYNELNPLFKIVFGNNVNSDIFKRFRDFPGLGVLTLNYRNDALMFNGSTSVIPGRPAAYLNLFSGQQPVSNQLKNIFPSTTAYSVNFSVSAPSKFKADLAAWYSKAGMKEDEEQLFEKIKAETGISISRDFYSLLGDEFAIVTTRYFEKFAIISVKDGSKLTTLLSGISKMTDVNTGQLNYEQLPFFLLGDAFGIFRRPYFLIMDNYLVLANSSGELKSYYDSYINRKFLSKNDQYRHFDDLLSDRSNVSFLMVFRNAEPIFKRDMDSSFYSSYMNDNSGWKSFYGASWQFSSTGKDFYTNFCMPLAADSLQNKSSATQ